MAENSLSQTLPSALPPLPARTGFRRVSSRETFSWNRSIHHSAVILGEQSPGNPFSASLQEMTKRESELSSRNQDASPPPLPPRRWVASGGKKSDVDELLQVPPPPPRMGCSAKKSQEMEDLISFSGLVSSESQKVEVYSVDSLAGILFDSSAIPGAFTDTALHGNNQTPQWSQVHASVGNHPLHFPITTSSQSIHPAPSASLRLMPLPRVGSGGVIRGYEVQHSQSAPELTKFVGQVQSPSLSNGFGTDMQMGTAGKLGTTDANVQNVLNFMKKKRNSNLIDLFCEESDDRQAGKLFSTTVTEVYPDDILKLFDPLSRELKEICGASAVQNSKAHSEVDLGRSGNGSVEEQQQMQSSAELNGVENNSPATDKNVTLPKQELSEASHKAVLQKRHSILETKKLEDIYGEIGLRAVRRSTTCNEEIQAFCEELKCLRFEFPFTDDPTNVGLIISPVLENNREEPLSIKLVINSSFSQQPVSFTCDVNTSIEHIISHVVCSTFDDIRGVNMENFVLKVHRLSEYFTPDSVLGDYEYVHQCHKFDKAVHLTLINLKDLRRPLSRTSSDDQKVSVLQSDDLLPPESNQTINCDSVNILLETLKKEIRKLKLAKDIPNIVSVSRGVFQTMKAICTIMSHVETTDISDALERLEPICHLFVEKTSAEMTPCDEGDASATKHTPNRERLVQLLNSSIEQLLEAVHHLLLMYSRAHRVDFTVPSPISTPTQNRDVTSFLDTLLLHVGPVHHIPPQWTSHFENYIVCCELWHGQRKLASVSTMPTTVVTRMFFEKILFDDWVQFDSMPMCTLPRETKLYFTLQGTGSLPQDSKQTESGQQVRSTLGWCALNLFDHKSELLQGSLLLGLWPDDVQKGSGPAVTNHDPQCPLLQISLPELGSKVQFPVVIRDKHASCHRRQFTQLDDTIQIQLLSIIEQGIHAAMTAEEMELIWSKRHFMYHLPQALPKIILAAHGWDWACLSDIYSMLQEWSPMLPVDAMVLLLPTFPDLEVRHTAIKWLKNIGSDELCDYLPQLVQVLRFETWENSPVVWFLVERALTSVRVAHHLYWLLKQNIDDPLAGKRMQLVLNALLAVCGSAVQNMIENQEVLLQNLSATADKIKATKDSLRLNVLLQEMEIAHHNLQENPTCLPLSPSLEVCGIDVKSCSYFTSNTLPLRIVFRNPEAGSTPIDALYKVGDDLRQDMLTLQMIRIMDKLWLKEGLDLKIVTFVCIPTDDKKGMVEMVTDAETLRKIQTEHGLTGSFKDRPIAGWLQKQNTSELEYQQAVENFSLSCAGYCVATYILGICDRHNDNIMLKTSGHLFHIDFGKFLGDAQMFGSIKRDRTPFVLTSDMAYVINEGDQPSKKFQNFVDLCCQAFNIVRRHRSIFLTLFSLMASSGIPGVSTDAVQYVYRSLLPDLSDAEATAHFTRLIQESLKSWFTQFNFFIHNLAQLRFTGDHNDELLLSFIPKTFTKESDGRLRSVKVTSCEKRYDPEKYYVYMLRVERENQHEPMDIFRSYREFLEFHHKLCMRFPLAKFPPLPRGSLMGRSNVREVALKRKMDIDVFLRVLLKMAEEIAHCSLVYTFLHPLLRDQEGAPQNWGVRGSIPSLQRPESLGVIQGQVKLSIVFKNNSLFIMVMHAKNLNSPKGTAPDPYVKTYLLPDANKLTKRKTKIEWKNCHPTFMEMLVYRLPLDVIKCRMLHVSVWDYDRVQENAFLGAVLISLSEINLATETVRWYSLGNISR